MGLRRYVVYLKNKVLRLSAGPHAIAAGFASGAAVSMFPFVGLHFLLGFVLAFFVRGNMLAAALGTAVGNPLTFPIIFSASYQLGNLMLGTIQPVADALPSASVDALAGGLFSSSLSQIIPALQTMSVGAIPISVLCFCVCYLLIRSIVVRFQTARRERLARRAPTRSADVGTSRSGARVS